MTYSQQALASSWSGNHQLLLLRVTWFSFPCSPQQCMGHLFPESAQARFVPMTAHLQNVRKSHLGICDIENGFCLVSPEAWVTVFDRCLSSQGKRANTGQREGAPGEKLTRCWGQRPGSPAHGGTGMRRRPTSRWKLFLKTGSKNVEGGGVGAAGWTVARVLQTTRRSAETAWTVVPERRDFSDDTGKVPASPRPKLQEWEWHPLSQETVFKGWKVSKELV